MSQARKEHDADFGGEVIGTTAHLHFFEHVPCTLHFALFR